MKKSVSRQSIWSYKSNVLLRYSAPSSRLRQSSSNGGRGFLYCYNNKRHERLSRLSRRSTYPLTYTAKALRHRLANNSTSFSSSTSSSSSIKKRQQRQSPTSPPAVFSALFERAATISSATASTTARHSIPTTLSFVGLVPSHLGSHPNDENGYPPVFHTQSLLFLFGFIFFPCWWIGAFCQTQQEKEEEARYQEQKQQKHSTLTMMPVHPSLLANGRLSSRILWIPQHEDEEKGIAYQHYHQFYHQHLHQQQQQIQHENVSESLSSTVFNFNHHNSSQSNNNRSSTTNGPLRIRNWFERERNMYRRWNKYMSFASIGIIALCIAMFVWYDIGVRRSLWRKLY
ncbi:hypothetical protein BDA99DRAFT_578346 [Phascolomyces articulosus]|uniref:Uncharacterized protein n=1 Tax=Phascolomyces articulosus TaxID=60185 RepID=A0AAD5KQV3_9FUNG|nr:hypothetical protein BDA99DRAFT_578346 [Phascolomyces articulosus]